MSDLVPIQQKVIQGQRKREQYLRSFSELFEKLAPGGFIPPQSIDFEQSLLGAMMIDVNSANAALEVIGDRSMEDSPFYRDAHTMIYMAMTQLDARQEKVDLLTVTNQLRLEGLLDRVGGPSYLVELTTQVVTTVNVQSHSRIVLEKHIGRELIRICEEIKLRAFEGESDYFDLLDVAEVALFRLSETRHRRSFQEINRLTVATLQRLDRIKGLDGVTGVPSGLRDLDRLTSGWQNTDLTILAARPSQGKTALALSWTRAAASAGIPVAFFSLEMGSDQLVLRLMCAEGQVDMHHAQTGRMSDDEWRSITLAATRIGAMPIFIDDTAGATPLEIRAKSRRLKTKHNLGLVVVDYLQLMTAGTRTESREREISMISRSLKHLAKELNIPVIALSQLNRGVESRADKRPMLSDLRESGAIEQDSDNVLFIYRPETYGEETVMIRGDKVNSENIAEIIVAKRRNGPVGEVPSVFRKEVGRFENYQHWPEFPGGQSGQTIGTPGF